MEAYLGHSLCFLAVLEEASVLLSVCDDVVTAVYP